MTRFFARTFIDHPQSINETYFQHMRFAGWFASRLFLAACAALVHALIPRLFERTAGNLIGEMHAKMSNRH